MINIEEQDWIRDNVISPLDHVEEALAKLFLLSDGRIAYLDWETDVYTIQPEQEVVTDSHGWVLI